MEANDRAILRNEREYVAKELADSGMYQDVVYELKQRNILHAEVAIEILNSETTKTSKVRNLLMHLERSEGGAFTTFKEVLMQFGLFQIVERLDPEMSSPHRHSLSGRDELDLQRWPNDQTMIEPTDDMTADLPTLPRPMHPTALPLSQPQRNEVNPFDITKPLKIKVKPAKEIGGSHHGPAYLYENKSMPRGLVFLVNYKDFANNQQPTRKGSEKDVKHLTLLFAQMGYEIPKVHVNLTKYQTVTALREFKNLEKLNSVDSCIIVIMSHGRDDKSFYTSDNQVLNNNDVVERFSNRECEALKGKPKIFIFQYCRGTTPDLGVEFGAHEVTYDRGLPVETDSAYQSQAGVRRDPTFTDMYIIYSTVEGFVSFRSPDRGSWLMEALCIVLMDHAHDTELGTLMKMVSRIVRQNVNDDGHKQVCEFTQRGFDRHFYFNPLPLNSTETLCMKALSRVLSNSHENLDGSTSPSAINPAHRRRLRPRSRSRGRSPDPFVSPRISRSRNFSGASNSSEHHEDEIDPANISSESVEIDPRVRRLSGNRRPGSESFNFFQPSYLDHLAPFNRSFSENLQELRAHDHDEPSRNEVFIEDSKESVPKAPSPTVDTVDHSNGNPEMQTAEAANPENSDINMNQAASYEFVSESRHSIKRQLSIPSTNETLIKLNDVKKYLQVHDSDPKLIEPLQRIESFVNKKKYEGKRRKKEEESSSLEY